MTSPLKLTIVGLSVVVAAGTMHGCAIWQQTPARHQVTEVRKAESQIFHARTPGICRAQAHSYYINQKRLWAENTYPERQYFGLASWYGHQFHGKKTANGETYNMHAPTAAHKTLPMNSLVEVTNLNNGKRTIVRINDRGPFVDKRIIDLSLGAARAIDMVGEGIVPVRVLVFLWGDGSFKHLIGDASRSSFLRKRGPDESSVAPPPVQQGGNEEMTVNVPMARPRAGMNAL